jgi:hypothetical protein
MRTILTKLKAPNEGGEDGPIYQYSPSDEYCYLVRSKKDGKLCWYDELEGKFFEAFSYYDPSELYRPLKEYI